MRLIDADLAIAEVQWAMSDSPSITRDDWRAIIGALSEVPTAQPERQEIGYGDCADATLKMWMDNVITDGEYKRIMDKLNKYWMREGQDE